MKKILFCIFSVSISFVASCQDATQWRGANRDGIYNETGLLQQWPEEGPEMLWHFDELGEGFATVSVTETMVYTAGSIDGQGYIFALDHNGSLQWKSEYGPEWTESWGGTRTTPLFSHGKLYILNSFGKMVCMDANNGNELWTVDLFNDFDGQNIKWGITENLLIHDNLLYCTPGGEVANVIALDKNTGKLKWKSNGSGEKSAYCSPQIFDHNGKMILTTMTESFILGFDALSGKLLWKFHQPNKYSVHANTPIYHNDFLYCVSGYGKGGVKLKISDNGNDVSEVWNNSSLDNRMGGVILMNNRLYGAGDESRKWICLDWETGEELYSSTAFKKGVSIAAEGLLYWYSQGGQMALVRPEAEQFNVISSFDVPFGELQHWAHPVIHNKRLYIRHGNSLMVYSIAR